MSTSLNLSQVFECVKNLVDAVRCTVCDKAEGGRVRFSCGHTTCEECLNVAEGCMLCLTPPSSLSKSVSDEPFSLRAKNACNLLSICQNTFNLDVYRALRTSEHLKTEKELFPECIQAPAKYFNKKKSLGSTNNKENLGCSFYPGENISHSNSFKMNKSNNYVQQWLKSSANHSRKALADLDVNKQNKSKKHFQSIRKKSEEKKSLKNNVQHFIKSELNLNKTEPEKLIILQNDMTKQKKNENDESGIVIDDEPILIEDSQSQVLDKDALALLAVEAADHDQTNFTTVSLQSLESSAHQNLGDTNHQQNSHKIPFYKKGTLSDCCFSCKKNDVNKNVSNNVSVTIENDMFVATISISDIANTAKAERSLHVQTDISEVPTTNAKCKLYSQDEVENLPTKISESEQMNENEPKKIFRKRLLQSPNIFQLSADVTNKKRCIVIEDSDSDASSILDVSHLSVTADVHRSCEPFDYGILAEVDTSKLLKRSRSKARGSTPDSNNSSDKENCDPNKSKKRKTAKKSKHTKKM